MIRTKAAIAAAKITAPALRRLGKGGGTLPGRIALTLKPDILADVSDGMAVTIVTGTNGKTTTTRMLEECFARAGYALFSDKTGANVEWGITGMFVENASLSGAQKYTHAVVECDEAYVRVVGPKLPVKALVVTNVFADQLDRFGSVENTLAKIREGVKAMPDATLVLNADCPMVASLGEGVPNQVVYFGANAPLYARENEETGDATVCPACGSAYEYTYHTFSHLGGWNCPSCERTRPTPDVAITDVREFTMESSAVGLDLFGHSLEAQICVPGGYNIYNAAAAAAAAHENGVSDAAILAALADFEVGFGRAEEIQLGATTLRMLLVKNAAGFNQVVNLLATDTREVQLAFVMNNRVADGTDMSWINDTNLELLAEQSERFGIIYTAGMRAEDMAERLRGAGFAAENVQALASIDELLDILERTDKPTYLMPTYTGMMESREAIAKRTDIKAIYE